MKKILLIAVAIFSISLSAQAQIQTSNITRSKVQSTTQSSELKLYNKGYMGMVEVGTSFGGSSYIHYTGYYSGYRDLDLFDASFDLSTSHGYLINDWLYAGAGFGVEYYGCSESLYIPIFANVRLFTPKVKKIRPFVDVRLGGAPELSDKYENGFYSTISLGSAFKKFTLQIGYKHQSRPSMADPKGDIHSIKDINGFQFKLGMMF